MLIYFLLFEDMLQVFFTISNCFEVQVSPAPFAKDHELSPHVGIDYILIQRG